MQNTLEAPAEIKLGSILEDFEPGDRAFWWQSDFRVLFGEVTQVDEGVMIINLDDGQVIDAKADDTNVYDPFNIAGWEKLPDESIVEMGDVMSTTHDHYVKTPGKREFFEVIEITRGKRITLRNNADNDHTVTLDGSLAPLDRYLKYWKLEG